MGICQVNSSSMMTEWSRSVYGAEEEVAYDMRGNFIFVNLPYSHYSVCPAHCGTLIKFDQCFPIKVELQCNRVYIQYFLWRVFPSDP